MSTRTASRRMYRIIFSNHGQIYEIYAKKVSQAELYGFVQVEEIVFGQRSSVVVDPSEERLKAEFEGVKRVFLPIYAVARIDEVEKEGVGRIHGKSESDGKVSFFPSPMVSPSGGSDKKQ